MAVRRGEDRYFGVNRSHFSRRQQSVLTMWRQSRSCVGNLDGRPAQVLVERLD